MYMNSVKEMFKEQMWKIKTSDTSTKYYDFVKNNQRNVTHGLELGSNNKSNKSGNSSKLFNSIGMSNFNSMRSLNQSKERMTSQEERKNNAIMDNNVGRKANLSKKKIKTYRKYLLSPEQRKDLNELKSSMNEKQLQNEEVNCELKPDSYDSECSGVLHSSTNCEKAQQILVFPNK